MGVASTSAVDEHGTTLDPLGMRLRMMPIPLLLAHRCELADGTQVDSSFMSDEDLPQHRVGEVIWIRKSNAGIEFEAELENTGAGHWALELAQGGALPSVSVGFDLCFEPNVRTDGVKCINQWRLREISLLPSGSNPDARIISINLNGAE